MIPSLTRYTWALQLVRVGRSRLVHFVPAVGLGAACDPAELERLRLAGRPYIWQAERTLCEQPFDEAADVNPAWPLCSICDVTVEHLREVIPAAYHTPPHAATAE